MNKSFEWFEKLKGAWIRKDIESIQDLLADDIAYYEEEGSHPMTTWDEIRKVWKEIEEQKILKLQNSSFLGNDENGTCRIDLEYVDSEGKNFSYQCTLRVSLDTEGKATEFRQTCIET